MNNIYVRSKDFTFSHSVSDVPDSTDFKMHTHTVYELYLFISGKGNYYIEGNRYSLHSGDILVINSKEAHYIEVDDTEPYERCVINFSGELIKNITGSTELLEPFESRSIGKRNLFRQQNFRDKSYKTFVNNLMRKTENQELNTICNLLPLLNEIYIAFNNRDTSSLKPTQTNARQIIKYISENLTNQISLDTICEQFYLSKSQLCRIFKQYTGSSVWEYVTVKRLLLANDMILSGESPSKIYEHCGFADYSVFYRAYKKYFGISPKQQQKRIANIH